jgi:hypothetical protein
MKLRRGLVPAAAALFLSCQTITEAPPPPPPIPTGPGPNPVLVIPVPTAPTPTPAPATPAPGTPTTPTPTPAPTGSSCRLGPGGGSGNNCPLQRPSFLPDVEAALDQLVRERPGMFDTRDTQGGCSNCYRVIDTHGYWGALVDVMQRRGFCATHDFEELAVKNTNAWNDQYDVMTGNGYIRRQLGAYRSTCYPAWF